MTKPRLVLDTNVWLDWLVFDDPRIAPVREALEADRAEICIDRACEAELARVLAYDLGRRTLDVKAQAACLERCLALARRIDATLAEPERGRLPACRDKDDQKFLEAALAAGAHFLITRDEALLALGRRVAFRIVRPEQFA